VKSALGEFSKRVSICRNKGTQSDLGAPFLAGYSSLRGIRGGLSPALLIIYHWYIVAKLSIRLPLANKALIIEQNL